MTTKLDQWEQELKPQISHVQLIGELNLSREDTEKLGRLIAELVHSYGVQSALPQLRDDYPCCLVTYLVFQGVYGYDEGDYWSGVCQTIGLPNSPNYTQELGQAFETALKRLGLSHNFDGHRYVGAILGHGGIPANSLHDFFEHVLQPSIERPEFASLSAREFIAEWLRRSYWYYVDKPVWRFLQNGDRVAEDFVERCRQMAWAYQETGEVPLAEEVGLPEAVVARYEEWIEDPARTGLRRQPEPRWARPGIIFDPWGQGVVALLPEQPLALLSGQREAWWEVCMDDRVERVPVRIQRTSVVRSEPTILPLQRPAREYRIRLVIDSVDQGPSPWIYAGVDDAYPFLVFDAKTGKLLPRPRVLPGRSLWLLCPPDVQLEPTRQGFIRERLPPLPWDWYTWSASQVDLSGLSVLMLHTPQGDRRIGVREGQTEQQPALIGGEVLDLGDESSPLYIGHPPRLYIPWRHIDSKEHLSHWRLYLRSEGGADPIRDLKASLDKFVGVLHWKADVVELPLDHPDLLGVTPVGQYRLQVRGPLGYRANLSFQIVPKLSVTGHEPLYLPDPQQGASPVQLLIETDAQSRLELLRDDATIQYVSTDARGHCYQVDIAPEQTDAPLRLIHSRGGSVTFSIPVRRLRWQLVLRPTENRPTAWQSRAIPISLAELDKSESPYLLVEAPGSDQTGASVQLRFLSAEGTILQGEFPSRLSRCYRFDLRRVRDSLRQSTSPVIHAELIAQGLPDHNTITLPVLTVRREIYIEQVTIVPRWEGDQVSLELAWQPDMRLSGRYVRFWSQTRPWAEPVKFSLPDTARGQVTLAAQADMLPIGEYLIEFIACDPWLPSFVERPSPPAPNIATVPLGDLRQRINQLNKAIAEEGERFTTICERVFLWRALGEQQRAKQDFQWCCRHLEEATEEQMLVLARAFEGDLDARIILRRVFRPERVRQKLDAYKRGELSEAELRSYLAQLPPVSELSSATQKVLLDAPNGDVQFQAAWELIWNKHLPDVQAVRAWTHQGTFPDPNKLTMLQVAAAIVLVEEGGPADIQTILRWAEERLQSDFNGPRAIAATEAQQLLQPDRSLRDMIGTWNDAGMFSRLDARKLILNLIQVVAAKELIKRDKPSGIQIVIDWIKRGLLSKLDDALVLCPELVLPGCWVRCQAGWGQIERIKTSDGQEVPYVHQDEIHQRDYNLDIRLRAEEGGEAITLDTARREIYFMRAAELYVCTKCRQFATADVNVILRQHNREAHGGVEASYERLQGNCLSQRSQLDFSARRPSNIWQ